MKLLTNEISALFFIILSFSLTFTIKFSMAARIKKSHSKLPSKNETVINETLNNNRNNSQIIQDFPLKIEIDWISIKDNLNLHLKRVEKGKQINENTNKSPYRFNNDTLFKSQTMTLEKLVSGVYILYAEKFDSLKTINMSNATVSIFSDKKSYYNLTCDTNNTDNINWKKPVFWEIGRFEFFSNSVVFETLNILTNEVIEGIRGKKAN